LRALDSSSIASALTAIAKVNPSNSKTPPPSSDAACTALNNFALSRMIFFGGLASA
jgi:hypothetical protein